MCRWSLDILDFEVKGEDEDILCLPRCDAHSCDGCVSQSSCENANQAHGTKSAGCEWDEEAQICFKECVPAVFRDRHGEGCFTCETKSLCQSQAHHGCSWDEDIYECSGTDIESVWYVLSLSLSLSFLRSNKVHTTVFIGRFGDLVNPIKDVEARSFSTTIVGNVVLENDGTEIKDFEVLDYIEQVIGHIVIHDNAELESINLENLFRVHGNIELMHNPNLRTIQVSSSLELVGCLKVVNNPNLDSESYSLLGRFRKCIEE